MAGGNMHSGAARLSFAAAAAMTIALAAGDGKPIFDDLTEAAGIDFVHTNGMTGELLLPEVTGPGGAFFDYDRDGDMDLYFVQGADLSGRATGEPPTDQLYRNDLKVLADGRREIRFTNVTKASKIVAPHYGMGAATGDFNNDGLPDLYVTNFGPNQMFRNNGDGTFSDVTKETGTGESRWSASAAFFDYDNDGWLDLYVTNYVVFDIPNTVKCYATSSRRDWCGPSAFKPEPDRLFHNRGDGTFEDVSGPSGIYTEYGPGLGVIAADFNGDGFADLYVANDGQANQLWINQKDGTFRNEALLAGVAFNRMGKAEAGMGVDAADFDGDGDDDLIVTHLRGETNTLYANDGDGNFEDRSLETLLAGPSLPYTGFGVGWIDFDNDSMLDLLALNGEVRTIEELARAGDPFPLGQPNQLFRNLGGGRFEEVRGASLGVLGAVEVSRGAAFGDVDNDGDTDVTVFNDHAAPRLLVNNRGQDRNWLGLRLLSRHNRDALGANVKISLEGGRTLVRRVRSDGSYCSANDPRVIVGLGDTDRIAGVQVLWPGGETETWRELAINQYHALTEGSGKRDGANQRQSLASHE